MVVAYFEVLSQHLHGQTKENHNPQSGQPIFVKNLYQGFPRIRNRSAYHSTETFVAVPDLELLVMFVSYGL